MSTKNHLKNNTLALKLISIFFGFAFWYLFMYQHTQYQQFRIPLSFHDIPEDFTINAPESVDITLHGKRVDFHYLDHDSLAVHIDASKLRKGENCIKLSEQQFFLPEALKLLNISPSTILIFIQEKTKERSST